MCPRPDPSATPAGVRRRLRSSGPRTLLNQAYTSISTKMQLFLQREPRTLYLVQDDWLLLFRKPPPSLHLAPTTEESTSAEASVVVQLLSTDEVDLSETVVVYTRISGTLGLFRAAEGESLRRCRQLGQPRTPNSALQRARARARATSAGSVGCQSFSNGC